MAVPCIKNARGDHPDWYAGSQHQVMLNCLQALDYTIELAAAMIQPYFTRTGRHNDTWLLRAVALWRQLPSELAR